MFLRPHRQSDLGRFMQRLTVTHVRRWHEHHHSTCHGHLYQGTYKSFPIKEDEHFLTVCRYVERNPLRPKLVKSASNWNWSSLAVRSGCDPDRRKLLCDWPVPRRRDWPTFVDLPQTPAEQDAIQTSIRRGRPYGDKVWQTRISRRLNLLSSFRPRGRPRRSSLPARKPAESRSES